MGQCRRGGGAPEALQASKAADLRLVCVEDCACVGAQVVQPAAAALMTFHLQLSKSPGAQQSQKCHFCVPIHQKQMLCMIT